MQDKQTVRLRHYGPHKSLLWKQLMFSMTQSEILTCKFSYIYRQRQKRKRETEEDKEGLTAPTPPTHHSNQWQMP